MQSIESIPYDALIERAVACALRDPSGEARDRWAHVDELQRRGGEEAFSAAVNWCGAWNPLLRRLGADALGRIGGLHESYIERAVAPLATLLDDGDDDVLCCALVALGHFNAGPLESIVALALHPTSQVRLDVAFCLLRRDEDLSRSTLVELSRDADSDVRDWATFGLGTMSDVDSPAIRDALVERLLDNSEDTRIEAMAGLAERGDVRAVPVIAKELARESVMTLAIQAAIDLPHREFIRSLEQLSEANGEDELISKALERCREHL